MGDTVIKKSKRRLKHRFFVPASNIEYKENGPPVAFMEKDTAHHIRDVLRLSTGAAVVLFDNSGQEYEGEIVSSKPEKVQVRIDRSVAPKVESPLKITLAQALIKGNSFDKILTLGAELGVMRFAPIFTSRTVVRLNKAAAADRVPRWERIVAEAAAQSGRVKVPMVEMPQDLKEFLERKHEGVNIILYEKGGSGQLFQIFEDEPAENVTLLAGPEGGFSQAEVKLAMDAGFQIWGIGPRILRAENAGAIACAMLQYQLGDMG
jgi:16S rRNA (uracil1498-N3)-methyltransferase